MLIYDENWIPKISCEIDDSKIEQLKNIDLNILDDEDIIKNKRTYFNHQFFIREESFIDIYTNLVEYEDNKIPQKKFNFISFANSNNSLNPRKININKCFICKEIISFETMPICKINKEIISLFPAFVISLFVEFKFLSEKEYSVTTYYEVITNRDLIPTKMASRTLDFKNDELFLTCIIKLLKNNGYEYVTIEEIIKNPVEYIQLINITKY